MKERLRLAVHDDGHGMDPDRLRCVSDPFAPRRATRKVGLGIPLLKAAAEACDGHLRIESAAGSGTRVQVEFRRSHIDRMPLGDLAATALTLLVGCPGVHWVFEYRAAGAEFAFDDAAIKQELGDLPLTEPGILAFVREMLEQGMAGVRAAADAAVPA